MLCEFQCFRCRHVKIEPLEQGDHMLLCRACAKHKPPAAPPMRGGGTQHALGISVHLVVVAFLLGVVVGTKMAGGW